ncbi:MAG TPA: phosphatidate cytidylyltransferase [Fimbriimonas sp.]|nr:phosphatidate cytidylyltransferase [Fimbriimonas sp.]
MKLRVLTSLVLAPVILLAALLTSPYPLFVLCLVVATIGFWELRTILGQSKGLPVLTLFGLVVPFFGTEIQSNRDPEQVIAYCCLFWLLGAAYTFFVARRGRAHSAEVDICGLWISMPLTCVMMLHRKIAGAPIAVIGHQLVIAKPLFALQSFLLLLLLPLWAGDIAGLLVGKWMGRHLLWPAVSPKKTWEGSFGNLVAATAVAIALAPALGLTVRWPVFFACGITIGIVGQAGDLFESYVKRRSGVKDSGSILPGHGGLLDRIDSLLFAAPFVSSILILSIH